MFAQTRGSDGPLQQPTEAALLAAIERAGRVEELTPLARAVREAACRMIADDAEARAVTQFISTMNDRLSGRIIDLDATGPACGAEVCWIVMGSEGRFEQTLHTDQDNAIIFEAPQGAPAEQVRDALVPLARRVNEHMNACGIPLCRGEIMAGNPRWCLSLAEWKSCFAHWVDNSDPQALLNATIFFDFRALHGARHLAEDLRAWLLRRAHGHSRFLLQMTQTALHNRPPLGLFGGFTLATHGGIPHTLDLKVNGLTPFVDGARIYSLAAAVSETETEARLRGAASASLISAQHRDAWVGAFLFLQRLRLRVQARHLEAGREASNVLAPATLDEATRRGLKSALRDAQRLQESLSWDFGFGTPPVYGA